MPSTSEILQLAVAVIADPADWCQGRLKLVEDGHEKRCSLGAVVKVSANDLKAAEAAASYLHAAWEARGFRTTAAGNDSPLTTHAEVMNVFYEAIRAAKERELG